MGIVTHVSNDETLINVINREISKDSDRIRDRPVGLRDLAIMDENISYELRVYELRVVMGWPESTDCIPSACLYLFK